MRGDVGSVSGAAVAAAARRSVLMFQAVEKRRQVLRWTAVAVWPGLSSPDGENLRKSARPAIPRW
eukprot:363803-Chlamydomonas_euryale.AAC.10